MKVKCTYCTYETDISTGWDTYNCPKCKEKISVEAARNFNRLWDIGEALKKNQETADLTLCYKKTIDSIAKGPGEDQLKKAMKYYVTNDYGYYLYKAGSWGSAIAMLSPYENIEKEKNPFISSKVQEQTLETLVSCYLGRGDNKRGKEVSDKLLRLKKNLYSEPEQAGGLDNLGMIIQEGATQADEGKFKESEKTMRNALRMLKQTAGLDASTKELFTLLAEVSLARSLIGQYVSGSNNNAALVDEAYKLTEPALPRLEKLARQGMQGIEPNYVLAELTYGQALLCQGHLIKGKKYVNSANKRMKLYQKGKSIL